MNRGALPPRNNGLRKQVILHSRSAKISEGIGLEFVLVMQYAAERTATAKELIEKRQAHRPRGSNRARAGMARLRAV